jgi:chorismate dehydratase
VKLVTGVPADLPGRLLAGHVDAALIPVVDYLRYRDVLERVSDACIGADGATMTVRVYSRVAPEAVRVLHADTESHTSVVLAQVLWAGCYHRSPLVRPLRKDVQPGAVEAVLLIGDKVVTTRWNRAGYDIDLGRLWKKWTGLPFVFAVWAAKRGRGGSALSALLESARNLGVARAEQIAREHAATHGWDSDRAVTYLTKHMKYTLEPEFLKGMETFLELASGMGLAAEVTAACGR